jgi:pimeloyl-ACP methyl ester carboxylesterase
MRHWISGPHGTEGFIATSQDGALMVLAFRGTEADKPEDLLADGFAIAGTWAKSGQVHQGFAGAYAGVRGEINDVLAQHQGALLITGHSLGAALATLAAADHADRQPEPKLITFGSPRVGDATFAGLLDALNTRGNVRRFVDCCDVVTRVPPEQFNQAKIEALLVDLVPASIKGLVPALATGLSLALRLLGIQPNYVHVGDAQYRDRNGRTLPAGTTVAADQQAARAAYNGTFIPGSQVLINQLLAASTAAAGEKGVRDAIRVFFRELFQGGRVPIRDLADHAPINYVSLFSGRI